MSAWDRMVGEPARWFDRFEVYRLLGPGRSLDSAYRAYSGKATGRAGESWWRNFRAWEWQRRAEAWDEAERERLRREEEERRRKAREERLAVLEAARVAAWKGLEAADLGDLDRESAREMVGALRMLLVEAMKLERLELGEPSEIVEEREGVSFTADELAKAEAELDEWRKGRSESSG